jgi:hypothetical protein
MMRVQKGLDDGILFCYNQTKGLDKLVESDIVHGIVGILQFCTGFYDLDRDSTLILPDPDS